MSAIEAWLSSQPEKIKKELTIQSHEQAGDMYRIDNALIKEFIPRFSLRQGNKENTTVPRVCVASTFFGCISGYGSFVHDFFEGTPDGQNFTNDTRYKGGVYITKVAYDYLIDISNKMVPDASISGEKWLVGYDKFHQQYSGELIGKAFVSSVSISRRDRGYPFYKCIIFLEVGDDAGLPLTSKIRLEKGFYKLITDGQRWWRDQIKAEPSKKELEIITIDKATFMAEKSQGIDLLDFKPPSASW